MLNVPGSRARLQTPLAPTDPRSGARTEAGAELSTRRLGGEPRSGEPPPPAMSGDGPYWSRRGRDRSALTGRAALGTKRLSSSEATSRTSSAPRRARCQPGFRGVRAESRGMGDRRPTNNLDQTYEEQRVCDYPASSACAIIRPPATFD